jgi:hypothetical protein
MAEEPLGKCCICRVEIPRGQTHYRCSVSACNMGKLKLLFCSRKCWEEHIPIARHRNARCIEVEPDDG